MWRFLLVIGIITYVFYKIGTFFFKIGAASQHMKQRDQTAKPKDQSGKIKGGDYVDYEEVKKD